MPIYEFKCEECNSISTFTMKMSDPAPENCPTCHKGSLRKLISRGSFVLKGGGWFSDSYNKSTGSEPKPSSDSTCSKKTEENPACCSCPHADD